MDRRNNSPSALELKCIEVWLISCTLFVFLALVEYFVVLFGMRYDKHWRHDKRDLDDGPTRRPAAAYDGPPPPLFGSDKVHASDDVNPVGPTDYVNNAETTLPRALFPPLRRVCL